MQSLLPFAARCLSLSVGLVGILPCQSGWRQAHPATAFPSLCLARMTHDDARQQLVAFGGSNLTLVDNATRLWDGSTWQVVPISIPAPPARTNAALAYDPLRQRVVMFGGFAANSWPLGDTWEWDGSVWLQIAAAGPMPRGSAGMAFDGTSIVLYGGQAATGAVMPFGDTWGWNGVSWQSLSPASSPITREAPQMAGGNGEILLFGGANASALFADTWRWNGSTWSQITTAIQPPARAGGNLVFDSVHNRYVLTGGRTFGFTLLADMFVFANNQWTGWSGNSPPPPRHLASAAFHLATGRIVIAGGYAPPGMLADTWEFGDDLASVTPYGSGCTPSSPGGPALAAQVGQPALGGSVTVRFDSQQGLSLLALGFSDAIGGFGPLPFPLAPLGAGQACQLLTSAEILVVMPPGAQPTATVAVPSNPALEDLSFFMQAVALPLPTLDFAGLTASNGLRCVMDLF